jgi:hypothetical protein
LTCSLYEELFLGPQWLMLGASKRMRYQTSSFIQLQNDNNAQRNVIFNVQLTNFPVLYFINNRKNESQQCLWFPIYRGKINYLLLIFSISNIFFSSHEPTFYTNDLIKRVLILFYCLCPRFMSTETWNLLCGTRQNFIQTPFLHEINCYEIVMTQNYFKLKQHTLCLYFLTAGLIRLLHVILDIFQWLVFVKNGNMLLLFKRITIRNGQFQ